MSSSSLSSSSNAEPEVPPTKPSYRRATEIVRVEADRYVFFFKCNIFLVFSLTRRF